MAEYDWTAGDFGNLAAASLSVAGTMMQYQGMAAQSYSSARALNLQADMLEEGISSLQETSSINQSIRRRQGKRSIGEGRVIVGASGVRMEGSVVEAITNTAVETHRDITNIQRSADIEELNIRRQARVMRQGAADAEAAARKAKKKSGLSGALSVVGGAVGAFYGGPQGAALGMQLGGAAGELAG